MRLERLAWPGITLIGAGMVVYAIYLPSSPDGIPCALCAHIRTWLMALIGVGILGVLFGRWRRVELPLWMVMLGIAGATTAKAASMFATESRWFTGQCDVRFSFYLPEWFEFERWLPTIFDPLYPCTRTPNLILGLTVADGLLIASAIILFVSLSGVFQGLFPRTEWR